MSYEFESILSKLSANQTKALEIIKRLKEANRSADIANLLLEISGVINMKTTPQCKTAIHTAVYSIADSLFSELSTEQSEAIIQHVALEVACATYWLRESCTSPPKLNQARQIFRLEPTIGCCAVCHLPGHLVVSCPKQSSWDEYKTTLKTAYDAYWEQKLNQTS